MRTLGSQNTATGDHRHTQKRDGCKGEVRGTARVWHLLDCDRLGHNAFGVIHGAWFVLIGRRTDIVFRLRHRAVLGRWRRVGGGRVPSLTRNARRGDDLVVAIRVERGIGVRERRMIADKIVDRSHYLRVPVLVRDRDPSFLVGEDRPRSVAVFEGYGRTWRDGTSVGLYQDHIGRTVVIVCVHTVRGRARGYATAVLRARRDRDEDQDYTQQDKGHTQQCNRTPHPHPLSSHNQRKVLCLITYHRATTSSCSLEPRLPVLHRFANDVCQVLFSNLSGGSHEKTLLFHRAFYEVFYVIFAVAELAHALRRPYVFHQLDQDFRERILVGPL